MYQKVDVKIWSEQWSARTCIGRYEQCLDEKVNGPQNH